MSPVTIPWNDASGQKDLGLAWTFTNTFYPDSFMLGGKEEPNWDAPREIDYT
jgi:hypothetical protein